MDKKLFSKVVPTSMFLVLQMTLALRCLLVVKGIDAVTIWPVFILGALLIFLGLSKPFDNLLYRQNESDTYSLEQKIELLIHLPVQKSMELFLLTFVYALYCTLVFAFLYHLQGVQLYVPIAGWMVISVVSAAEAYLTATRATSKAVDELMATNEDEVRKILFESKKRSFIGIPLNIQFGIYVLLPITLCFSSALLLIVEDLYIDNFHLTRRMVIMAVMTIFMVIVNSLQFFLYVKRTARRIESIVDRIQQGEEYVPERVDAATEIAYTAQLVDKIHSQLTCEQQATERKKQTLIEKLQNLLTMYPVIEDLLKGEQEALETVLEQLQKMDEQNAIIHTHVKESRQIARKTSDTVAVSQRALTLNEQKIHEIAAANKTATGGIQALSTKINGIWEIVDLIDSIADQTKIIAFNAELESEKIDHNREKFKNVAYAIRNLTDQVLTLTGKIRTDIKKIQDASNMLLSQGKSGTSTIENGVVITSQLASTLKMMETSADDSAELSETVRGMIENFTGQVVGLQKLLSKSQTQIQTYAESIRKEIELARETGRAMGVEE